ncbi:MAG: TatD family hydrolase [Arcticibacter sp.]
MNLFDIHHHSSSNDSIRGTIINLTSGFSNLTDKGFFSIGLHPWYLNEETIFQDFEVLKFASSKPNVVAIGECGLDKVCKTDWALQENCFRMQIDLAEQVQKPLIIHCVKAYPEVLGMIKKQRNMVPVVFHGFNKNNEIALEILNHGYHLSFGKHLFNENTAQVFTTVPLDRLFLETDASDIPIAAIYEQACSILDVSIEKLQTQIEANTIEVFGKSITANE